MTWDAVLSVLSGAGILTAVGWAIKEAIGYVTGGNARKMREARTALSVMSQVGAWQDAYYRARAWCWTTHGYHADYPPPPNDRPDDTQED